MKIFNLFKLMPLFLLAACASTTGVSSIGVNAPFLPSGGAVEAPEGYLDMCRRSAALCADQPIGAGAVSLGSKAPNGSSDAAARMVLLNRVNRYVNDRVLQRTDREVYGVEEYWNRSGTGPGAAGDCEDLAIEKRMELIDQGYPPHDLFYAVVFRRELGLHVVLIASTETGDMVLDSRTPYVTPWTDAPYIWVKRQSRDNPANWTLVQPPASTVADSRVAVMSGGATGGLLSVDVR